MVRRITVDGGVLRSVVEGELGRVHLEVFRRHDVEVVVPAPALVECTVGEPLRDARINVVIRGCRVQATTEQIARRAAALREKCGRVDGVVDAMIVATCELAGGASLLTSRPEACAALAVPTGVRVEPL